MVRDRPDQISDDRKGEVIFFGVNFEMFTARDPVAAARMCDIVKDAVICLLLAAMIFLIALIWHICSTLGDPRVWLSQQGSTPKGR